MTRGRSRRNRVVAPSSTPAKAGAQLGDGNHDGLRTVIAAFPTGPQPPPGWCTSSDKTRAILDIAAGIAT